VRCDAAGGCSDAQRSSGTTQRITTVQVPEELAPSRTEPAMATVPAQWGGLQLSARGTRALVGVNRRFLASWLVKPGRLPSSPGLIQVHGVSCADGGAGADDEKVVPPR
jgi:hypothetical protein